MSIPAIEKTARRSPAKPLAADLRDETARTDCREDLRTRKPALRAGAARAKRTACPARDDWRLGPRLCGAWVTPTIMCRLVGGCRAYRDHCHLVPDNVG